jgi:hypothetical protein
VDALKINDEAQNANHLPSGAIPMLLRLLPNPIGRESRLRFAKLDGIKTK